MKKTLLVSLLCSALYAHAFQSQCINLVMTIQNNSPEMCVMTERSLINGKFVGPETYFRIPAGRNTTLKLIEYESTKPTDFILSYECGNGRFVTFKTQKYGCLFSGGKIFGSVTSVSGMDASYEASIGSLFHNKPGSIVWTLA